MNAPLSPTDIVIRTELRPGDIGYITWMHGMLYAKEQGWDHTFEAYVAGPLAEFAKNDSPRQRIWIAEANGRIVGTIALVEASNDQAQLRWLLVDPGSRGCGLGKRLLEALIGFAKDHEYRSVFLWTVNDLRSAGALYKSFGFKKTFEECSQNWGKLVTEERYDLEL